MIFNTVGDVIKFFYADVGCEDIIFLFVAHFLSPYVGIPV